MRAAKLLLVGTVLVLVVDAVAAPIRVGIFKSVGPGRYFHTSIHTGSSAIVAILANPDSANLGLNLIVPQDGFVTTLFGMSDSARRQATDAEQAAFISALDTLDVVVFPHITDFGASMPDINRRNRLLEFFHAKGVVSIHGSIDTYGTWPSWDSIHGTRFQNWTNSDRYATLHLDTASRGDPNLGLLNRGLPDTARFFEEWMSFTTNGDVIRAKSGLKVAVTVDESSYAGGMGNTRVMGDHPISWFRELPGGGRFFFTALGHRTSNYLGTGSGTTPGELYFLRRQLYNAILWAAGSNEEGTTIHKRKPGTEVSGGSFGKNARMHLSGGTLTVSLLRDDAHTVEIRNLEGRRIDKRRGTGKVEHRFEGLGRGAAYIVEIRTAGEMFSGMIGFP